MLKLLLFAGWTILVMSLAFTAGRWVGPAAPNGETGKLDAKSAAPVRLAVEDNKAPAKVAQSTSGSLRNLKPSYASDSEQLPLLVRLTATNPQLAMEKARQLKGLLRAQAEAQILNVWGTNDPHGAWTWVEQNRPTDATLFLTVLAAAGRSEPQVALAYAKEMAESHRELRRDIYVYTIEAIAQGGAYTQAMAAIDRLDIEADTLQELRRLVLKHWAVYEPDSAARWLKAQPEDATAVQLETLVKTWANADAQAATNFAASLTGNARDELTLSAFRHWLETDPASATSWLSAQKGGDVDPLRNEAATMPGLLDGPVQAALDWAGQMADSERRINTLTSILAACKQKDPRAAADYLRKIPYLSEAERARLHQDLAFTD